MPTSLEIFNIRRFLYKSSWKCRPLNDMCNCTFKNDKL